MLNSRRQTRPILLEPVDLPRGRRLGLILELTIDETILAATIVKLILVNFEQVFGKSEAVVALVRDATSSSFLVFIDT